MRAVIRQMAASTAALVMLSMLLPISASAMVGDSLKEYTPDASWRGVASDILPYSYTLASSPRAGHHVSSVYVRRPENDIHVETGIDKRLGWIGSRTFWQYNSNPYLPPGHPDNADWDLGWGASIATGNYVYFEANNLDMGGPSDTGDRWRMAWNGNTICTVWVPMIAGEATIANERENYETDNGGDDSEAQFRNVKKKNNSGSWSLWADWRYYYDQDPWYWWGHYSTSHHYQWDEGRP